VIANRIVFSALLTLAASAATAGCATAFGNTPRLKMVDPGAPRMLLGINDAFHSPLPAELTAHYCDWNRDIVLRSPVLSAEQATALRQSVSSCPRIHVLLLIEGSDSALAAALAPDLQRPDLPPVWGVELGNERDLAGLTPQQFGAFVGAAHDVLRAAGFAGNIVTGGIYTVDRHEPQDFARYLAPAIAACPDCIVGLHWYGDTSDRWIARVQALNRPVAVTEFGMPSCTAAQDDAQLAYLQEKLAAYARVPALAAVVYQRPSGPELCNNSDNSHLAHFGLQRPDGSWKPGEQVMR
jgi:hypothetical protein